MFIFSISYMGCHPSHSKTLSFFKMVWGHHQPVMIFMEVTGGSFGMAGIHWDHEKFGCPFWDESPA
jgi:hypothetical protein